MCPHGSEAATGRKQRTYPRITPARMEEKQLWSEVHKVIRKCERRCKRSTQQAPGKPSSRQGSEISGGSRQKKYDIFMLAVEEIMKREHEVNMDITLKGDMARAFHISMAIGRHLWNKNEDVMVQRIMQAGVEHIINEYNSEIVLKEAKKHLKPLLKEILKELEDDGLK